MEDRYRFSTSDNPRHAMGKVVCLIMGIVGAGWTAPGSTVQFTSLQYSESEGASAANLLAVRDATTEVEDLRLQVTGGSAATPANYFITTNLVRFPAGAATTQISIYLVDDAEPSGDRDLQLELAPETPDTTVGEISTTRLLIQDDDLPGFPGLGFGGYRFQPYGNVGPRP